MFATQNSALAVRVLGEGVLLRRQVEAELAHEIGSAADLIVKCIKSGNKVLLCGNGGSAADAQHIAAEFVGRYVREREPLPALALHTDTSALTAIGNDYGFAEVFARQVTAFGKPGDVLIAITTSGRSPNILRAVEAARALGMSVIGLTGAAGRAFADSVDVGIAIPSNVTARVQELHITVGHILCEALDAADDPVRSAGICMRISDSAKERSVQELVQIREALRRDRKRVVFTSGVFDLVHSGHLASFKASRLFGDVLVVGVNDDASVKRYKGDSRPIFPLPERLAMLGGLELVDYLVSFGEDTPAELLAALRPDVYCKGAEYAPPHGRPAPEADIVRGYGGVVEFIPLVAGRSSTETLRRLTEV
jgi:phosphoheptose isomerase